MSIFKKLVERLKGRTTAPESASASVSVSEPVTVSAEPTSIFDRYKADQMATGIALASGDFGWDEPDKTVKVRLVNPHECAENKYFRTWNLVACWRGTGHSEWEFLLADSMMRAVMQAEASGDAEADVSDLFNRTFLARGERRFTAEQVEKHLENWFEVVRVGDDGTKYLRFTGNKSEAA